MSRIILVVGGTGNLGGKIVEALLKKGAIVHAVVRNGTSDDKISKLETLGAKVFVVNMMDETQVSAVCTGASCVVSALAGLRDVVIDTQLVLLNAAVKAGVPRFIPSDYSLDFTRFVEGENRNLDLRREFHTYLNQQLSIRSTTIFNGAFMDLLTGEMPMILFKRKMVLYWGSADHRMIFTTVADTANYTASVALDNESPRYLRVAGDLLSPREISSVVGAVSGSKFRLIRAGGPRLLSFLIKVARKLAPGNANELYPAWQGMQYMRNMIDGRANLSVPDAKRYPGMQWTTVKELLTRHVNRL